MSVPSNWEAFGDRAGQSVVAGPQGGLMSNGRGQVEVGYGVLIGQFQPRQARNIQQATQELVNALRSGDPSLQVGGVRSVQVNGRGGLMAEMRGSSPLGGPENTLLVTVPQGNGVIYCAFAAPQQDWPGLQRDAMAMLQTLELAR